MASIQSPHAASPVVGAAAPLQAPLPASLLMLLAISAGLSVASLYYSQPMLGILGADLGASTGAIGLIPTATQLGYALGLLFLAPLGDRYDRRRIIVVKAAVLCAALLLAGASSTIGLLLVASLIVGLAATMAQDVVPAAATLAPEASRGKTVGIVMTGLLLGILLSRVVSGFVAEHFGWRTMFVAAAAAIALVGAASWRGLPRFKATTRLSYGALLASLLHLWRRHAALRRAAWAQGLLGLAFSAFWSTLAVMLHGAPFHLGSAAAGAFGLAGAAGALSAPLAGKLADRKGPELVTRLGAALVVAAFVVMGFATLLPPQGHLWLIAIAVVGFDLGMQAALIAHQTIVYGIDPGSRSRLNAVLFTATFIGMAVGSAAGALMLAQAGWIAVVALAVVSSTAALVVRLWPAAAKA